jgi:hypothetical protein
MPVPSVCLSVHKLSFPDFFPLCAQLLHWNFVHGFICMTYRSSSKMVAIAQFLEELCPLILQFSGLFSLSAYRLVHCFAIPRYRSSLSLFSIHWFFTKLWPLDLEKYHELSVFRTFSPSAYRYSFNISSTLFCHTKLQIKFKFGFLSIWNSRSYGPWT